MNATILVFAYAISSQAAPLVAPTYSPFVQSLAANGVIEKMSNGIGSTYRTTVLYADATQMTIRLTNTLQISGREPFVAMFDYPIEFGNVKQYSVKEAKNSKETNLIRILLTVKAPGKMFKDGVETAKDVNFAEIPASSLEKIKAIDQALKQSLRASNVNCPAILGQ